MKVNDTQNDQNKIVELSYDKNFSESEPKKSTKHPYPPENKIVYPDPDDEVAIYHFYGYLYRTLRLPAVSLLKKLNVSWGVSEEGVNDLIADTLLALKAKEKEARDIKNLLGWLYNVMRNKLVDLIRKDTKRHKDILRGYISLSEMDLSDENEDIFIAEDSDETKDTMNEEKISKLRNYLGSLSQDQKKYII